MVGWRPGLIDEATNGAFGRGIEAALCQELQCFRAMVDGVTDREHASARAVVVRGDDGARYLVAGDGSVSRVPTAPKFLRLPDGLHIDASFSGDTSEKARKAMEQAVRARANREGFADPEKLVRQALDAAISRTDPLPRLNFSTDLYTVPCYRATAKIACNLLALHDRDAFLDDEFDPIRSYVLEGADEDLRPAEPVAVSFVANALGPLDHLVSIRRDGDGTTALVVYFGFLGLLIRLSNRPTSTPFRASWSTRSGSSPTAGIDGTALTTRASTFHPSKPPGCEHTKRPPTSLQHPSVSAPGSPYSSST